MSDELFNIKRERDLLNVCNVALAERCERLEKEANRQRARWKEASGHSTKNLLRARDADALLNVQAKVIRNLQIKLNYWRMDHPDSAVEDPFDWDTSPYPYPVPEEYEDDVEADAA